MGVLLRLNPAVLGPGVLGSWSGAPGYASQGGQRCAGGRCQPWSACASRNGSHLDCRRPGTPCATALRMPRLPPALGPAGLDQGLVLAAHIRMEWLRAVSGILPALRLPFGDPGHGRLKQGRKLLDLREPFVHSQRMAGCGPASSVTIGALLENLGMVSASTVLRGQDVNVLASDQDWVGHPIFTFRCWMTQSRR